MAIIRNGKVYRNIQEQVLKNTEDIDELNHRLPIEGKFYTEEETDALLAKKQNTLVSSGDNQNIKTINGQDILGTGNIVIPIFETHLYQLWFSKDIDNLRYDGLFLIASDINIETGNYSYTQMYQYFGYKTIRGSGGAINKSNEVVRVSPLIEIESNDLRVSYNEYDSIEDDWIDDDFYIDSIRVTKIF